MEQYMVLNIAAKNDRHLCVCVLERETEARNNSPVVTLVEDQQLDYHVSLQCLIYKI